MKKLSFISLFVICICCNAQIKSPEEFLGYKIGSRYTPHHKIVSYFQYITLNAGTAVKLKQYGETNEHRPLYLAFVSSEENIKNLESLRLNNLRLANLSGDKPSPIESTSAFVWLSYNVHGNETSSSEAAMLTLFALVDPTNTQAKQWLKNTVVIIDPCLNPDGRERYVNWFNSVVGLHSNPELISREHSEPWPGGRLNHYYFDLNRDWAWQTQVESRARIKEYNEWMPQVHVDFHEQGINQPYYFAPAAQPYHEVITKWQRDFQVEIGKNHAKYFDRNNWLYFTKEIFDLLYPSYGDTYPVYNGSIGMTYEQAGGPVGGLAALTDEGDTLTLYDRAIHHFTTSMSTIEISSQQNSQLTSEFRKYFSQASALKAVEYKTYIIKNISNDNQRIAAFLQLLDNNKIEYGTASGNSKGYNYFSKKEENFPVGESDIVISGLQPKSALVKVLFEPQTKLVDSATYDITAWALPYVYGLTAYASKQAFDVKVSKAKNEVPKNSPVEAYGYVIKWQGVSSVKTIAALLKRNIKLRFTEIPFETAGQTFDRGSVIILKKGNEKIGSALWTTVSKICNDNNILMHAVSSGMVDKGLDFGSSGIHVLKAPRVTVLAGDDVNPNALGEIWHFFEKEIDYKLNIVNTNEAGRLNWNNVDVLILADGRYSFLSDKEMSGKLKNWIENGGRFIALEGAAAQLSKIEWSGLHSKNTIDSGDNENPYSLVQPFNSRDKEALSSLTFGSIFKVDVDNTHPLMFGYPKHYYTLKRDNAVYEFLKEGGWNTGVIKKESQLAGYVGYKLNPKLKDGLLFGVQELGNGKIIYLTDNVLFRDFWENGKLMFCNAVFLVGQ